MATLQRFLSRIAGTANSTDTLPATVGGAGSAGQIVALNTTTGLLDTTMMPPGIGPTTVTGTANSALTAGQFVNITGSTVKPADATTPLKANGFVLQSFAASATATVYLAGQNTAVTGLTPGPQYLGTAGAAAASTSSLVAGNIAQYLGDAISATLVEFNPGQPITIA